MDSEKTSIEDQASKDIPIRGMSDKIAASLRNMSLETTSNDQKTIESDAVATPCTGTTTTLLVKPHSAAKVIKGEIHNVLTVMRSDARYASPVRFSEEITDDQHPLLANLRDLHSALREWEAKEALSGKQPDALLYLPPFCEAISGREISASITGASLSALHKFLLYGFILPGSPSASEGMTLIANSLKSCTFEETADGNLEAKRGNKRSVVATIMHDDEQVVLKLLELCALVVRCSLLSTLLIPTDLVVDLLDTCLYVSHKAKRASPLLKSAAADALRQIILQVFAGTGAPLLKARSKILSKLSSLLNPQEHSDGTCATSLTLVNIAFETLREKLSPPEIVVLQNDLCKYLLQWTTTHDLVILSLTLRVIFNLFQSIRNDLKVALEVFLTSVHLRILDPTSSASNEEKEVALESLLEFCQEPALMQDIYLNYDCDVQCTNLFESICAALGKAATSDSGHSKTAAPTSGNQALTNTSQNAGSAASVSGTSSVHSGNHNMTDQSTSSLYSTMSHTHSTDAHPATASTTQATLQGGPHAPLNILNRLALEGVVAILDSIFRRCKNQMDLHNLTMNSESEMDDNKSEDDSYDTRWQSTDVTQDRLTRRKQKKYALGKVAALFNDDPFGKEWLELALADNVIESAESSDNVAELLYITPDMDKVGVGLYLGKGPPDKYPFHAEVLRKFAGKFDFKGCNFVAAFRKFLSKFRLPGESQCIERIMEVFSKELYLQHGEDEIFKNDDAVFVLSFSTIMLNTDLHNPNCENKMTVQEFIRNNRGINNGEDFPADYLTELYDQIKERQIKVKPELNDAANSNEDFRQNWDGLLQKATEVETAFFTPADEARQATLRAGIHDREMFVVIAKWAVRCFSTVFARSWDDSLIFKALNGFKNLARMCEFFQVDEALNDMLQSLLGFGRDYIMGCVALEYAGYDHGAPIFPSGRLSMGQTEDEEDEPSVIDTESPVPTHILITKGAEWIQAEEDIEDLDLSGCAAHRGLLALDLSFLLVRKNASKVKEAWPAYIECICALRDARGLPAGLSDLDDFADSNGNVLPLSVFAQKSQRRLDDYYRSILDRDSNKKKTFFRASNFKGFGNFFGAKKPENAKTDDDSEESVESSEDLVKGELSSFSRTLLSVAESAEVEKVVQMGSTKLPAAEHTVRALLEAVDEYPYDDDPVLEQHAIFSLELAARALLSNRDKAPELFTLFLAKFESILSRIGENYIPAPFVVERVVVTVLRSSIHLYDLPELRPNLRASLHLLMMALPKSFIRQISDRMACGLAIILRASFHYFETHNEWAFMGDTLDMLANYGPARGFVFDGIASTVEYAMPQNMEVTDDETGEVIGEVGKADAIVVADNEDENSDAEISDNKDENPTLSMFACTAVTRVLIRFVLGFYQGDLSLAVPAMLCLEKVYRHTVKLLLENQLKKQDFGGTGCKDPNSAVPDKELWQNVAVAVYSVCRSEDKETSRHGTECYQRLMMSTSLEDVPDDKWIAILYLMVNKQPPLSAEVSRGNTFAVLGQIIARLVPTISAKSDNWDDLADLITSIATLAEENLREGRRGSVSILFEKTMQAVTSLSNHLVEEEFGGSKEFNAWASQTLMDELEKVGAGGGSIKNVAATTKEDD